MRKRRVPPLRRAGPAAEGMTILEAVVGVLIAATALAILTPALTQQLVVAQDDATIPAVDAVVSRDLAWISNYARWWMARSGPFNVSTMVTLSSAFTFASELTYTPPANRCLGGTLAAGFLSDAATNSTITPARPYPIPTDGSTTNLATVNGVTVQRAISTSGNTVALTYSVSGGRAASLGFNRQVALLVYASAWCERLP